MSKLVVPMVQIADFLKGILVSRNSLVSSLVLEVFNPDGIRIIEITAPPFVGD